LIIIAFVFVVFLGFLIGQRYLRRNSFAGRFYPAPFFNNNKGRNLRGRIDFGMGTGSGQISKIDGNNITIQKTNSQTYTITINDNTVINKMTKGSKEDLKTGKNIIVWENNFVTPLTIWVSP
jgi:hypothetical protein